MQSLVTSTELEAALREPLALLYKHSDRCPISAMAFDEIARVAAVHSELPVHVLDVHAQRPLARYVAEHLDVRHESPQVILLRRGVVLWHASHYGVTARAVSRAVALSSAEAEEMREAG
jgi:bacillithiol system protein YtxJ